MSDYFVLDNHTPVRVDSMAWALWFETADRVVAQTDVPLASGSFARVSTVFLGLDHSFSHAGPPVLWETMIFWTDHELDQYQERYTSKADALAGHETACQLVRDATPPPPPPANEEQK